MAKNKLIIKFDAENHAVKASSKNLQTRFGLYRCEVHEKDSQIDALIPGLDIFSGSYDEGWDLYLVGHGVIEGTRLHGRSGAQIADFLHDKCGLKKVNEIHVYSCYGGSNPNLLIELEKPFATCLEDRLKERRVTFKSVSAFDAKVHVNTLGMDVTT